MLVAHYILVYTLIKLLSHSFLFIAHRSQPCAISLSLQSPVICQQWCPPWIWSIRSPGRRLHVAPFDPTTPQKPHPIEPNPKWIRRRVAGVVWNVTKCKVSSRTVTDLGAVLDPIVRRRSSIFGHVARLPENTTAYPSLAVPHRSVTRSPSRPELQPGGDVQAAFGTGRLTNSAGTTVHLLADLKRALGATLL